MLRGGIGAAALLAAALAGLAGCGALERRSGELSAEAQELLEADQAFAARALERGAAAAFGEFLLEDAIHLTSSGGEPFQGRERITAALAAAGPASLTWVPRYAEVFDDGDVGWTWGEWQVHEPGAGGRRLAQGKYINLWRRTDEGWKLRADLGTAER